MPLDISGDIAGLGKIVQIQRIVNSTRSTTNSTSATDATGMTISITPTKINSTIIIVCNFLAQTERKSGSGASRSIYTITNSTNSIINGGSTEIAQSLNQNTNIYLRCGLTIIGFDSPGTNNLVSYKLRFQSTDNGVDSFVLNDFQSAHMLAIEVAA